MPQYHFDNTCITPKECKRKPWKNPSPSFRDKPFINPASLPADTNKCTFFTPVGILSTLSKYRGNFSLYRELSVPNMQARIVEYYQYIMQPVSILIVLPDGVMTSLKEYGLTGLKKRLPDVIHRMTVKHMQVRLPSSVFKHLEKAKISMGHQFRLNERISSLGQVDKPPILDNVPRTKIPSGSNFEPRGPFVIVLYDKAKELVLCLARVYKLNQDLGVLGTTVRKLKELDEKLINILLKSNALEAADTEEVIKSLYEAQIGVRESEIQELIGYDNLSAIRLFKAIKSARKEPKAEENLGNEDDTEDDDTDDELQMTEVKHKADETIGVDLTGNESVITDLESSDDEDFTDDESVITVIEVARDRSKLAEGHAIEEDGFDIEAPVSSVEYGHDEAAPKAATRFQMSSQGDVEVEQSYADCLYDETVSDMPELSSSEMKGDNGANRGREDRIESDHSSIPDFYNKVAQALNRFPSFPRSKLIAKPSRLVKQRSPATSPKASPILREPRTASEPILKNTDLLDI